VSSAEGAARPLPTARSRFQRMTLALHSSQVEAAIRRELAKGRGIHAVARAVSVGARTVQRVRAEPARTA
jgi:hypothetical protein